MDGSRPDPTEPDDPAGCPMRFTIVVPTYNRRDVLLETMRSLANLDRPWPCELVVVVNGSGDGSLEAAQALAMPFPTTVLFQPNAGAAAARNYGASRARGEFLLFLDDDMVAEPRLLVEHDRVLQDGADAVVGHIPLHPDSPRTVLTLGVDRWARKRLSRLQAAEHGAVAMPDLLTGQLSVRASRFTAIGGFDESFTATGTFGAEDTDFLYRLVRDGAQLRAAPTAVSWQRYVVTPEQHLRQWRQGGRADAFLARKHPALAASIVQQHHGTGPRGLLLRSAAVLPDAVTRTLAGPVVRRVSAGRTDLVTRTLFSLLRDVQYWAGARAAGGLDVGGDVVVLAYHAIDDVADPTTRQYAVPPEELEGQIRALLTAGAQFIDAQAYLDHVDGAPAPPGAVLLTFDDGYRSVATGAAPLLKELGIPAVVFLVSTQVGGTNAWDVSRGAAPLPLLDADEVRQLLGQGWEVGSHSRTHAHLAGLDRQQLEDEVSGSRDELTRVGLPVPRLLAYPYGEHHLAVRRVARRAGYAGAFALDGTGTGDRFALSRVEVQRGEAPAALVSRVRSAAPSRSTLQARRELRGAVQLVLGGHALRRSRSGPA